MFCHYETTNWEKPQGQGHHWVRSVRCYDLGFILLCLIPTNSHLSVLSSYLCYKRDGPPACNKTLWPHTQNRGIRTSFKQKWPSPSLIPSNHSLDLVTPAFVAEALDSARDSSWTIPGLGGSWDSSNSPEAAVPIQRRSAPLFFSAQSAPFQLDRKALVIFLPWHFGGMLGEEILCDLPSHIVLRHKSKPKFGISIKPVLYRVAFQSFTIPSSLSLASPGNGLLNVASPESPLPLPWQTPKASIHLLVPAGVLTSRKWWGPDCFTAHLIWFPSVFASIHIKPIENCSKNTPRNKNSSRPIKRH